MNSCPTYDVSDAAYARFNAVMETMNEQLEHFVSWMREFDLLSEIGRSLHFPGLETSLYDDYDSSQ